jgi:hypothetical protein
MAKTEITSKNQSGGITAQNVSVQSNDSQFTLGAGQPPKEKNLTRKVLAAIAAIVAFLAAVVKTLEYFRISPF